MISQDDLEAVSQIQATSIVAVRSVLTRYMCGETVEPGFFTVADLINFDRGTTMDLLAFCVKATDRAIRLQREQLLGIGNWNDHLRDTARYWQARWQLTKLRLAIWLMRAHIVDVIDTEAARARISAYLNDETSRAAA